MNRTRKVLLGLFVVGLLLASGLGIYRLRSSGTSEVTKPIVGFDTDHEVYPNRGALVKASDLVVVGRVSSSGVSTGADMTESDIRNSDSGLPSTDYVVEIQRRIKGDADSSITVSMLGGETADVIYSSPSVPILSQSGRYVFFLVKGEDGKYYPLAGSTAIGQRSSGNRYTVGAEATGGAPLTIEE